MISDNEEMLKRIMRSNFDGSKDLIIAQTKREIIRLNKAIERKTNGPKRGFNSGDIIKIENQILEDQNIQACTLSTSAIERISKTRNKFKYLIVDEAGQTTEPNTIIPLKYDFEKIILLGDHKQLPATVFNEHNKKLGFDISLFERMMKNNVTN